MKKSLRLSALKIVVSLSAFAALVGCGGGGNGSMPAPTAPVYPYNPNGYPNGPIVVPTGTQCAAAMPVLSGVPTPISALIDGEAGCIRLVSVEQYQDVTANNGYPVSSIVGDTEINYVAATRRGRAQGLIANMTSDISCSDIRSRPYGQPGAMINLPLWIDRRNGSVGQNIRITTGRSRQVIASGAISASPRGWNLDAFARQMSAQGFQALQSAKLPNGDVEIFLSRRTVDQYSGGVVQSLTRAVYSLTE